MAAKSQITKNSSSKKNPIETLNDSGSSLGSSFVNKTSDIFDNFFGNHIEDSGFQEDFGYRKQEQFQPKKKIEVNLFNHARHHEDVVVEKKVTAIQQEIQTLQKEMSKLTKEIKAVAPSGSSDSVKGAEKLFIDPISEKAGIYHEKFLEFVLSILKNLRAHVGESRTWLQAFISKKKKRGSAFITRGKDKGTQYTLSNELTASRAVQ